MICQCCGKKVDHLNSDFRFNEEGQPHRFGSCDDCLELSDTEFFKIISEKNDVKNTEKL